MTDDDDTGVPFVPARRPADDGGGLSSARYPRVVRNDPPAGLGRRERRRWRAEDRREQVAASRRAASSWGLRGAGVDALGPVVLVLALLVAGLVWFRSGDDAPAPAPSRPADAATATATGGASASARAETVPLPAADPALPAPFDARGGTVARELVLAWNTYDPSRPDAVDAWVASWSALATDVVAATARDDAPRLWDSAVADQVTVGFPVVTAGTAVVVEGRTATFTVTVQRSRTPLPGTGGEVTVDTRDWRITVTGDRVTQVMDAPAGISE